MKVHFTCTTLVTPNTTKCSTVQTIVKPFLGTTGYFMKHVAFSVMWNEFYKNIKFISNCLKIKFHFIPLSSLGPLVQYCVRVVIAAVTPWGYCFSSVTLKSRRSLYLLHLVHMWTTVMWVSGNSSYNRAPQHEPHTQIKETQLF